MVIGCLGDIVFEVSEKTVETIKDMEWAGSARYAVHERHLQDALTEFTGREPDTMKFSIILNAALGVDVMDELIKIWTYQRNGEAVPLVVGDKPYGKYRWNIVSNTYKYLHHDRRGNPLVVEAALELQEYLRG